MLEPVGVCIIYFLRVGATHRFYESRRRLYNDSRPARKEPVLRAKQAAKRKETRKRVRNTDGIICPPQCHIPFFFSCTIQGRNS